MIKTALIIGFGEVGRAHWKVLKEQYAGKLFYKDKGPEIYDTDQKVVELKEYPDLLMIATQCDPNDIKSFCAMVYEYACRYMPGYIDILTTTPCGTVDELQSIIWSASITKSTIRGMHPCLDKFLIDIPKHIGGPCADKLKDYYGGAGVPCVTHAKARATELFHVLNNSDYGVATMKAQENYDLCRHYGVDYMEYLEYKKTNNKGFIKAGYPSKVSPILTPPNGPIGGHCVVYSASTIPQNIRGPLMDRLAIYNDRFNAPVKSDKN